MSNETVALPVQPFNKLKDCRHGPMLYNIHDMFIGRSLELYGEFSQGEVDLFDQIVEPGDVVLDVGANIGALTVPLAKALRPGGIVVAFEPQRLIHQTLCANVALNSLANVFCFQTAAGEAPGSIHVPSLNPNLRNNFGGLTLGTEHPGEKVPLARLDSIPLQRCDLIKVDVEGMERQVLIGAAGLIEKFRPILYVENDREEHSAELIRHIDSIGYHAYWHRPPLFNPRNFLGNTENVFGMLISINMLCLPKNSPTTIADMTPIPVPPA